MGRTPVKRRAGMPGSTLFPARSRGGCPVIMNINTKGEYTIGNYSRLSVQGAKSVRYTC